MMWSIDCIFAIEGCYLSVFPFYMQMIIAGMAKKQNSRLMVCCNVQAILLINLFFIAGAL